MPEGRSGSRLDGRLVLSLLLLGGLVAIVIVSVTGASAELLQVLAHAPAVVRSFLSGFFIVLGGWLLLRAIRRIDGAISNDPSADGGRISDADLGALVRAVRLVFLSAASFTAAGGWLIGDPLPLVIALVIAGVDVAETSFLLLVATRRSR
ncbi:MAG: hypothetical protein HYX55_02530 [Chloroflexi bacterium]|nr:hypothetical protein [Chloroflexota bacterium]